MLTRRDLFKTMAAAGAAALAHPTTNLWAAASQPSTPVDFAVPAGACDTHTHIFGDPKRFPMSPSRVYTPETASIPEMRALHRALHTQRVVIVQPSIYGSDNSCTLDAIRQLGPGARGVAVIDDKTTASELAAMNRGGIRGVRLNLTNTSRQIDIDRVRQQLESTLKRLPPHWHVQFYTNLKVIRGIQEQVRAAQAPIVFDHFGGADAELGVRQAGFPELLDLVRSGKAYVKISAPYRCSKQAPDYPDVAPLAKALISANPERILWGTDWPHPNPAAKPGHALDSITPLFQIDDGRIFNLLPRWAPEASVRKLILVDNPARLYGY